MNRWFEFKFRMVWPDNEPAARWWLDILILDIIIREILEKNRDRIELWRIHRRADKKDEDGHQFTFYVYTSEDVSKTINGEIEAHAVLQALKEAHLLTKYFMVPTTKRDGHLVEATSEEWWPEEIQRSWPYYIMGVSEMLLHLVDQVRDNAQVVDASEDIDKLSRYYIQLNQRITARWQHDGQNPFLHYLNALFGYQPIVVTPRTFQMLLSL